MEIWSCPDYLIIHLKRFSHSRGMFGGRKINQLIQFPLEGLDLTNYLLNNKDTNKKVIYDLYAVSNHFGSLNGGHYTAFCRNPVYNKWFDFDDSSVSKLSPGKINTKAAYVLFYKKRQ
jgi:ubiquitin carboxyl-terminal hydrolase 4/11/15